MGINITQFAPPSRVSTLVWDKNMEPPAGKVFEGDLVGDVTGHVTGDLTGVVRGSLLGYLSRNGVVSASSGTLVVPASSSTGNDPTTVNLNLGGGGTYAIVGNTQKCYLDDPCNIPVVFDPLESWQTSRGDSYAKSYTSDGVLIDSISASGDLNIYGAAYIVLNGGTWQGEDTYGNRTGSIADAYIDAGKSLILGDDTPPDGPKVSKLVWDVDMTPAAGRKFNGNLTGDVTGNVNGKTIYTWSITPKVTEVTLRTPPNSTTQLYQVSPGELISGTVRCYTVTAAAVGQIHLLCISAGWETLLYTPLTDTPETYTLPANTAGIYITSNYTSTASIKMSRFVIT